MAEESSVRIVSWPEEAARLEHRFDPDEPCPVAIHFTEAPAKVVVSTGDDPIAVDMDMNVAVREPIPVCIKVCEPICARSAYTIGITIFDQPFAEIGVRGETRLFNCDDEKPGRRVCADFKEFKSNVEHAQPISHEGLVLESFSGALRTSTIGDPGGQVKLSFPDDGIRIEFPQPIDEASIRLNNYGSPQLKFSVFAGTTIISQFNRDVSNAVAEIAVEEDGVTAIEIRGGSNESAIIEVCYRLPG